LREAISTTPQEPTLFEGFLFIILFLFSLGSIRFNLDPFNKLNDSDILQALERVGLSFFLVWKLL
jgi:ABC-type multidrug transport system fused ATPase/permease subunit